MGPVFRAENSHTGRHLTEFTGLDFEMEIKESYSEALDMTDFFMTKGLLCSECVPYVFSMCS